MLDDAVGLPLGPPQQRALLAVLLLHRNTSVSTERLIDELWGERPPPTAAKIVRNHVSGLRKTLGQERLITHGGGYELRVGEGELDLERFELLLERARLGRTDDGFESALVLWRGEPLADFGDAPFARTERLRLEDLHVQALEAELSARVERGESAHLVGEIQRLVARYPLQERLHALLMLALYRADRQAEALGAYRRARRTLREELGLEPSRRLQELERRILNQDESLAPHDLDVSGRPQALLRRPPRPASHLPVAATPFLGREQELAEIRDVLADGQVRLLTLTGPGGTGKTRLALQAAAETAPTYFDGVFWVPLAPLRDPALVLETVAQRLGAKGELTEHVGDKTLLLLLDNFEHVIGAAVDLAELLAGCPNLHLLVTSRELLRLPAEQSYDVPPLQPRDGLELFLARARAIEPGFVATDAVAALCDRLENLPLALELAAARVRVLSPKQLVERLSQRLDLLKAGRGVDPRQQTLRATFEWSHDLLDEPERRLFASFAVFRGGCTVEMVEDICGADLDTLQSLIDKSLIRERRDAAGEPRFSMLETIREYADEKLQASGAVDETRRRHAEHLLRLVEQADSFRGARQREWVERFETELDNLRAALDWLELDDAANAARLANGAARFLWMRGYSSESRTHLERVLGHPGLPPELRAQALVSLASLPGYVGDSAAVRQFARDALALFDGLGDKLGMGNALIALGNAATELGELEEAGRLDARALALFREVGERHRISVALTGLANLALVTGDYDTAAEHDREVLAIGEQIADNQVIAVALIHLGEGALGQDRIDDASLHFSRSLELTRELDPRLFVYSLLGLAGVLATREPEAALRLLGSAEAIAEPIALRTERLEEMWRERTLVACRASLGDDRVPALWEDGRRMGADDVAEYALEHVRGSSAHAPERL